MYNSTPLNGLHYRSKRGGYFDQTTSPRSPSRGATCFVNISRDGPLVTPKKITNTSMRSYSLSSDVSCISPPGCNSKLPNGVLTSTQIDTRSPGYAGRLVRYNEERERAMPTHQSKYQGLGIFPIVHMFKKEVPTLKKKSHNNLSIIDLSRHNSPEHNRKLLEKIVRPNPVANKTTTPLRPLSNSEVSTRSVLDALKEISRKRIHASEQKFDFAVDDGKRIRLEQIENNKKKRSRGESPPIDGARISPIKKKVCSSNLDELKASYTSSTPETANETVAKSKPIISDDSLVGLGEKSRKVANAETQTVPTPVVIETRDSESNTTNDTVAKSDEVRVDKNTPPAIIKNPPPLKIFDDEILEVKRKNRLAILMGMFEDKDKSDKNNCPSPGRGLVSILSASNQQKTVPKSVPDKHVTFNLPANSDSTASNDANKIGIAVNAITTTSVALATPITTPTVVPTGEGKIIRNDGMVPPTPSSSPVSSNVGGEETASKSAPPPTFVFKQNSAPATVTSSETETPVPSFNFESPGKSVPSILSCPGFPIGGIQPPTVIATASSRVDASSTAPTGPIELPKSLTAMSSFSTLTDPKIGGFKFNLGGASSTAPSATSTTPKFSFGGSATISPVTTANDSAMKLLVGNNVPSLAPNSNQKVGGFGLNPTAPVTTSSFRLGGNSFSPQIVTCAPLAASVATVSGGFGSTGPGPTFNFGAPNASNLLPSTTSSGNNSGAFGLGQDFNKRGDASMSSPPNFGGISASTTSATANTLGVSSGNLQTSNVFGPGASTTAAPMFRSFSTAATAPNKEKPFSFGGANATVTTAVATTSAVPVISTQSMFGSNTKPLFGDTGTRPVFGVATTTASATPFATGGGGFNSAATTKSFGSVSASSAPSGFSFVATPNRNQSQQNQQQQSGFGMNKPIFGSGNNATPFAPTPITTANNGAFGTQAPPSFGSISFTTPATTVASTVATFGSLTSGGTGSSQNQQQVGNTKLGSGSGTFYSNSFNFGGSSNIFGGSATTTAPSTITSGFGSTTTTAPNNGFGSNNVFGTNQQSSDFRPATNNASGFGGTGGFGTNPPAFGESAPAANAFGFNNNTFGQQLPSSSSTIPPPNRTVEPGGGGVFSFGNAAPAASGNNNQAPVFSFGSIEPPRYSFNLNSSAPSTGGFGSAGGSNNNGVQQSSSSVFGNVGFGAPSALPSSAQFGAPAPNVGGAPGMFNIGSGTTISTPGRARTQLRAKRRT